MNLLNACLALMLVLGVFASVVTVLVELLHQLFQQRQRDLRGMLGYVFDLGVVRDEVEKKGLDVAVLREDFTTVLRCDKVLGELVEKHGVVMKFFVGRIAGDTSMGIEDFLRRLPRSGLYQKVLQDLSPEARKAAVSRLVAHFERAGQAIAEYFQVRAKLLSFLVGVCLAVFVNVDAVRLFEHFVVDPAETESSITRLQGLLATARQGEAGGVPQAVPAAQPGGAADAAPAVPTARERAEEITAMLDRLRAGRSFGLPIGWAYYPYCVAADGTGQIDPRCRKSPAPEAQPAPPDGQRVRAILGRTHEGGRPVLWFFSVVVTGFLFGLGGPYWFDLAMSLSRFRDFLKSGQDKPQDKQTPPPDADALVDGFIAETNSNPASG